MFVGALFLSLSVAPTGEVLHIAHMMAPWQEVTLLVLSLAVMHGFVYFVEFRARMPVEPGASLAGLFVRFTVVGYVIVLLVSFFLLWVFGRVDGLSAGRIAQCCDRPLLPRRDRRRGGAAPPLMAAKRAVSAGPRPKKAESSTEAGGRRREDRGGTSGWEWVAAAVGGHHPRRDRRLPDLRGRHPAVRVPTADRRHPRPDRGADRRRLSSSRSTSGIAAMLRAPMSASRARLSAQTAPSSKRARSRSTSSPRNQRRPAASTSPRIRRSIAWYSGWRATRTRSRTPSDHKARPQRVTSAPTVVLQRSLIIPPASDSCSGVGKTAVSYAAAGGIESWQSPSAPCRSRRGP